MTKNLLLATCLFIQANAQEDISFLTFTNASSHSIKLMLRMGNTDSIPTLKTPAMDITILEAGTSLSLREKDLKSDFLSLGIMPQLLELTLILPMNDLRLPCVFDNIPLGSEIKLEDKLIPSQYLLTLSPTAQSYILIFKTTVSQKFWAVTQK